MCNLNVLINKKKNSVVSVDTMEDYFQCITNSFMGNSDSEGMFSSSIPDEVRKSDRKLRHMHLIDQYSRASVNINHTRISTSGKDMKSCQPFANDRFVLIHNGIFDLSGNKDETKYSDTWYFWLEFIKQYDIHSSVDVAIQKALDEAIDGGTMSVYIYDKQEDVGWYFKNAGRDICLLENDECYLLATNKDSDVLFASNNETKIENDTLYKFYRNKKGNIQISSSDITIPESYTKYTGYNNHSYGFGYFKNKNIKDFGYRPGVERLDYYTGIYDDKNVVPLYKLKSGAEKRSLLDKVSLYITRHGHYIKTFLCNINDDDNTSKSIYDLPEASVFEGMPAPQIGIIKRAIVENARNYNVDNTKLRAFDPCSNDLVELEEGKTYFYKWNTYAKEKEMLIIKPFVDNNDYSIFERIVSSCVFNDNSVLTKKDSEIANRINGLDIYHVSKSKMLYTLAADIEPEEGYVTPDLFTIKSITKDKLLGTNVKSKNCLRWVEFKDRYVNIAKGPANREIELSVTADYLDLLYDCYGYISDETATYTYPQKVGVTC